MNTSIKNSLSDIRLMILCEYPLSTEAFGHCYYDGDRVDKDTEEAYVWYQVARCGGNQRVGCLIDYLDSLFMPSTSLKLLSRAQHIYTKALQVCD